MEACSSFRIYLLFLLSNSFTTAQNILLFSDHEKQGQKLEVSISQCSNLPDGMAKAVTSVNTNDHCAKLYSKRDCNGDFIEIMPRSPTHHNLHFWGFNDKAISIGPCVDKCALHQTASSKTPENGEGMDLVVFSRKDFKGAYQELNVHGCTLIPAKFVHRFLSIKKTYDEQCFELYNNVDCKNTGSGTDSIELRKGTPFHNDISTWYFPEARAVSDCSFNCNRTAIEMHQNNIVRRNETFPSSPNEVFLFDGKNFRGNQLNLTLNGCTDIMHHWEGAAMSMKTFNNTCVVIYEKRDCKGDSFNVVGSNSDLSVRSFDLITRSIEPCFRERLIEKPSAMKGETADETKNEGNSKQDTSTGLSPLIVALVVILPLIGVLVSVVGLVLLIIRRCNPYKNIIEMLSEKEIQEFINGIGMDLGNNDVEGGYVTTSINADYSVELLAQNKPYNESFEITRSNIKFDTKAPLGMGEFGIVYKGNVQIMSSPDEDEASQIQNITVAVKTVRPNSNAQCLRSLLKEVKVMLFVGRHQNIVHMIGCCTENLRKGEVLVLMEFCTKGSLEGFLQKNRSKYRNFVKKGRLSNEMNVVDDYRSTDSKRAYENSEEKLPAHFDFFQLLNWCIDVCSGMEFLSSRKVIHSDLAARNVLLDASYRAKISDFGLSKQLYCYTQYVKKRQEPLPWRWLALESLKSMEFSSKSDVWGFGVLCWEIFTLGEKPYPGVVWSDAFIRNLEDGLRLGKPKYTVTECYNLMIQCWTDEPDNRPSFSEVLGELQDIRSSLRPMAQMYASLSYA